MRMQINANDALILTRLDGVVGPALGKPPTTRKRLRLLDKHYTP